MTLRATRHFVEIAGIGDSDLRATRQYVEVAGIGDSKVRSSEFYVEVISHIDVEYERSIEQSLGVGHNMGKLVYYARSVTDDLGLAHDVDRLRLDLGHDLGLYQGPIQLLAAGDFQPLGHSLQLEQFTSEAATRTTLNLMPLGQLVEVIGPIVIPVEKSCG